MYREIQHRSEVHSICPAHEPKVIIRRSFSLWSVQGHAFGMEAHCQCITDFEIWDSAGDDFQQRATLEVAQLCLRVGIVVPAIVKNAGIADLAAREREVLGGMQVRPAHVTEGELRQHQFKSNRLDINVQGASKVVSEVQAAALEKGHLALKGTIGVIC